MLECRSPCEVTAVWNMLPRVAGQWQCIDLLIEVSLLCFPLGFSPRRA